MKKIFVFLFLFFSIIVNAQDNEKYKVVGTTIIVEKVIPFSVSKETAVNRVRDFFVLSLNDSNKTVKLADDDVIIVKCLTPTLATYSMGMWSTNANLTIEVKFKENRMKITTMCSEINNESSKQKYTYRIVDAAPINETHDIWKLNIRKDDAIKTFNNLVNYMNGLIFLLETEADSFVERMEEDW